MRKINLLLGLILSGSMGLASAADSLFVDATGQIGVGTDVPVTQLHVLGSTSTEAMYRLEQSDTTKVRFWLVNTNAAWSFDMLADGSAFQIAKGGAGQMLRVTDTGELYVKGVLAFDATP